MASQGSACKIVGSGGVGESGSYELLTHKVIDTIEKLVVVRPGDTSLCPNTGAAGMLLVNGQVVDQGILSNHELLQASAKNGDQVVAIVHTFPLFNAISCVRLGELSFTLEVCDLVTATNSSDAGYALNAGCAETQNWYSWNNKMPPPPDDFHVVGEVVVPNPGVQVQLVERSPQGINPAILLMDLVLFQLPGQWPQILTTKQVRYDKVLVNSNYEEVDIFQANKLAVKIPVDTLS